MNVVMDVRLVARENRRREFAAFLRSRRERLTPDDVGLPHGFRRRALGLRREEVALLAGAGPLGTLGSSRVATCVPQRKSCRRWRAP
jgi:hypothetical protein